MSSPFPYITRGSPLDRAKRFRSSLAGDAKFFGYDSGELVRFYNGALAATATTLYTCPRWKRAKSMGGLAVIHNPTAGAITFDLHHVPSGGAVNNNNKLVSAISVAADETRTVFASSLVWHCLMPGDALVINPGGIGLNVWGLFNEEKDDACAFIGGAINSIGAAAETTILTCPATRTLVLANIVGQNFNVGAASVKAHARESGVAASDANEIMAQAVLAANGELEKDRFGIAAIGEGGVISALSDVTSVNFWANAFLI